MWRFEAPIGAFKSHVTLQIFFCVGFEKPRGDALIHATSYVTKGKMFHFSFLMKNV